MLKESAYKLVAGKGHCLPLRVAALLVAKRDFAVLDRKDTAVGDSDTMHITTEVRQDFIGTLESRFAINDPFLLPGNLGNHEGRQCFDNHLPEHPSKDSGECFDGNQILFAGRQPFLMVGNPTGRYQAMNVGVIEKGTGLRIPLRDRS